MTPSLPVALSIAGSDPSGGAGIQADLKTFSAHGVYGMAVVTALTAQNTHTVSGVHAVDPAFVTAQLTTLLDDILPRAIKVGMLANATIVCSVARAIAQLRVPIVLDPVMVSTSGSALLSSDAEHALITRLLPHATLVTPNLPEAERLLGDTAPATWAARSGVALLLKDGHNMGTTVRDRLFLPDGTLHIFESPRIDSRNTHGTGCTLSSAIAAGLALGHPLPEAVEHAHHWLATVIQQSATHTLGGGHGPLLHGPALRARLPRGNG